MSSSSAPAHRSVTSIRRSSNVAASPASPITPIRNVSSSFSSPSSLRAEDECVIIDLGCRFLRVGLASDAIPKAVVPFEPERQRRAGDFTGWEIGYGDRWRRRAHQTWGEGYELWQLDLRGLDLEHVANKIALAMRQAYQSNLLLDARPRRMVVSLASNLPLALLATVLDTLFIHFQSPTISIVSSPVLSTVAAGLRAALVVEIGWLETVVTAVYEYREIQHRRSIRAGKTLSIEMLRTLSQAIAKRDGKKPSNEDTDSNDLLRSCKELVSFSEVEEIVTRLAWCKSQRYTPTTTTVTIPMRSTAQSFELQLPFDELAEPCERALFAGGKDLRTLDDEEQPLHLLVYQSLLRLPVDVRSLCMARIVFTGGCSQIPGIKTRVLDELTAHVSKHGWDPVRGKAVDQVREKLAKVSLNAESLPTAEPKTTAGLADQEIDLIEERLQKELRKGSRSTLHGTVRAVETLGAWSGASLLSQLKIPAVAIVEREQWLQQGLSGASKPGEINLAKQRQSLGPGGLRSSERSNWTLGIWG